MKKQINPGFGWAPNTLINDPNISLKAKGIWLYCNSKPEKWSFSIKGIESQNADGRVSISNGLKELEENDYLEREQLRDGNGFGKSEYILRDGTKHAITKHDGTKHATSNKEESNKDLSKIDLSKKEKGILDFFSKIAGRKRGFVLTDKRKKEISTRAAEFSYEMIEKVIEFKAAEWIGTDMEQYFNPDTLFRKSKFVKYVEQIELFEEHPAAFPNVVRKVQTGKRQNILKSVMDQI